MIWLTLEILAYLGTKPEEKKVNIFIKTNITLVLLGAYFGK